MIMNICRCHILSVSSVPEVISSAGAVEDEKMLLQPQISIQAIIMSNTYLCSYDSANSQPA